MSTDILTNAFSMASPSQSWTGLWAHPESEATRYTTLDHWADLARTAERGLIDGIFLADGLGIHDVYQGAPDAIMRAGGMFPVNDPMMMIPAMAAATSDLCFGVTANSTYEPPYLLARRFSTLDHLTDGRVSWNVVTGIQPSAARAMGVEPVPHDQRYDIAEEYMDLMYRLWEESWEDGAAVRDRDRRVFTDPARVHRVRTEGRYACEAFHPCEPSPQRTPFIYSAGGSPRGMRFAGTHAEAAFMSVSDKGHARRLVDGYRAAAVDAGRSADSVKVFNAITVVVAPTEAEARDVEAQCREYSDGEGNLAMLSGFIGQDLSKYGWDDPVEHVESDAMQSVLDAMTRHNGGRTVRIRDIASFSGLAGIEAYVVGSPSQVCDELISWVDGTGIDGFNLLRTIEPGGLRAFTELVVPELQDRGRYKTAYRPGTFREKMFPHGGPHLPADHVGARYRRGAAPAREPVSR
ncbi:flavin-dependent oxidoreductase [Pseudonocardia sp. Ae168_Ps1]|uniref:NtaA/DmoA family FMN-dependent monooxygenase n=1 Tax=unclassified Pseudonocardia TaxID=2619320 RepID=UPI0009616A61|nr:MULTISPECIES: NtaA/DmoA family FMN-dependent monooxygenase [unclassified Pseudonocardia]OLL76872.1 flavin-dependent oxidoreductase [Pseudonocardia sp. Ae150A_Ps1]OLL82886.1 flavin-dependent oxidoreductase [Pseudonocardia sp. Ae168_Ps1]OLL83002.1 flavin-dependent oxidoreductase [Pseudonocardia sp. Ae263_Ps1]OLL90960.1 flavin-dependent oxidoreductase [Pseudonocardia sp. Ae356_Ps1]